MRKLSKKQLLYGGIGLVVIALVGGIAAAIMALMADNKPNNSTQDTESQSQQQAQSNGNGRSIGGNARGVSGSVTSLRNLKGLTLRINQLDTCSNDSITAYVAVSTDQGTVNTNFNKKDVKVYLDGKEIKDFNFDPVSKTKQPLNNVLVIDKSGSMVGAPIENAKSAATKYAQSTNADDKTGLIAFGDQASVLNTLTTDKAAVTGSVSQIQAVGNTALYDALSTALDQLPNCGRQAVTVLSDGDDTSSKSASVDSVAKKANDKKLPIFSMGIEGEGFNPAVLTQLSDGSGGQYLPAKTPTDISNLYQNIDSQLRGQFAASFKISLKKDGQPHTIRIVSTVDGSPTESSRTFTY